MITVYLIIIFLSLLLIIRTKVVHSIYCKQADLILEQYTKNIDCAGELHEVFERQPSFNKMIFQFHKWTRQQFYGDKP